MGFHETYIEYIWQWGIDTSKTVTMVPFACQNVNELAHAEHDGKNAHNKKTTTKKSAGDIKSLSKYHQITCSVNIFIAHDR